MKKVLAGGLYGVMVVWSAFAISATPETFTNVTDRDDYEMGLFRDGASPVALCQYGTSNKRYPDPASACRAAYTAAMNTKAYDQALRYAARGCEAFRDQSLCQAMSNIPFHPAAAGRSAAR